MGSIATVFVLTLFCVTLFINDVWACSCINLDNYSKYCQAEFAVKAYVVKEKWSTPNGDRVYRIVTDVKGLRTLKGNFGNVDLTKVYTASSSAMCGVTLQPGKVYLLSGYIDKSKTPHRLRILLCDWIQLWDTLTLAEKSFVRKGYLTGCHSKLLNVV